MLTVSYDGSRYHGWQIQPNGVTVQECVERGLKKLLNTEIRVLCAGRTDSGVHARGQVVSFRTESTIPPARFAVALQTYLPEDVIVLDSREVHADFHATFRAVRKRYCYLIADRSPLLPWLRHYVVRSPRTLNAECMNAACRHLIGTYDFRCFESHYPNKATSVRTVLRAEVYRTDLGSVWRGEPHPRGREASVEGSAQLTGSPGGPSDLICLDIEADGFLYNMVRAIAGSLMEIGVGRWEPERMQAIVEGRNRSAAGPTAPPQGLYLMEVEYPEELMTP